MTPTTTLFIGVSISFLLGLIGFCYGVFDEHDRGM